MVEKSRFSNGRAQAVLVLCLLAATSLMFFHQVLAPDEVLFSNDGPVGELMAACHQLPERFTGCWEDLHTVGYREGAAIPNISFFLQWLLKPVWFSKFYAPAALVLLGFSAWTFFRQLKLSMHACILGGLAAMWQSAFCSVACWGVAAHPLTIATTFLALAALADTAAPRRWLRTALAGLCVGMGVAEGADVGALCSTFVVLFVVYQALIEAGPRAKNILVGVGRVALIATCALLLAACAVSELVSNDIKDIAGAKQDVETRAQRWKWATQWSLPKREALGIIVPGLFGYRVETGDGSQYWGAIGRAVEWDEYFSKGAQGAQPKEKYLRSSGTNYYPGVLVMMLALWAVLQTLRTEAIFESTQRKWIWFWSVTLVVSLLFAFGRYAPFYRLLYALPYFSTIRNPIKFLYFLNMAFAVLFAFGVDGFWRAYVNRTTVEQKRTRPGRFERLWLFGSLGVFGFFLIAWVVYGSYREPLERYLQSVNFDANAAHEITTYSLGQVGVFLGFFAVAALLVNLALRRFFTDHSASLAAVIFGTFLVLDLGFANHPWAVFLNYRDQNATNAVLNFLGEKPYEHRVVLEPFQGSGGATVLDKTYRADWQLHQFSCYNIQSLNIAQLPRTPSDLSAFNKKMDATNDVLLRKWELTNTRYLLGNADSLSYLNGTIDPALHRFSIVSRFTFVPRPGVFNVTRVFDLTAVPNDNGQFALIEFTGALPRARLYSNWQTNSDAAAVLDQIASPSFDPEQIVVVTGAAPAPTNTGTNAAPQNPGTVAIESYAPKRIELKADAAAPAILLLNDRYDSNWRVFVDGRRDTLLRCNYLMRGVYLSSGSHTVEFRFEPPTWPLYISLATLGAGILLAGFTFATSRPRENQKEIAKETPKSQRPLPKRNGATATASRK